MAAAQAPQQTPSHLAIARQLLPNLASSPLNVYGGGKRFIDWKDRPCQARTVCSSFATLLLEHTYGWDDAYVKSWLGLTNPKAEVYHDAIAAEKGFTRIVHVSEIRPGDYLAIKYTDGHLSGNGAEDSGHIMLVDSITADRAPKTPMVAGTKQYFVTVIDSSATGHGPTDTRHIGPSKFSGGIGRGVFRVYATADDLIAGYTWSDEKRSPFYTSPNRDLVVGRLKP